MKILQFKNPKSTEGKSIQKSVRKKSIKSDTDPQKNSILYPEKLEQKNEHAKNFLLSLHIAISGKSGCGNTTASRIVSEKLNIRLVNYTFRNLAKDEGVSFQEIRRRSELNDEIDRLVDKRQMDLAIQGSCILGSRLAIWMLKEADLRVYLNVNLEERVHRIQQREGYDLAYCMQETIERDQLDHERYLRIYGINNDNFSFADIIINSNRLDANQVADLIIGAIPKECLKKLEENKIMEPATLDE